MNTREIDLLIERATAFKEAYANATQSIVSSKISNFTQRQIEVSIQAQMVGLLKTGIVNSTPGFEVEIYKNNVHVHFNPDQVWEMLRGF